MATTKSSCANNWPRCSCGTGVGSQAQQNLYSFASEDRDMLYRLFQTTKLEEIPLISHADDLKMRNLSPVTKAPPKVEKEKSLINPTITKPTGVYGTDETNKATGPSPSSSRSSHSDAPPSREEIPPSPSAVSAGQALSHAAKKKAKAARREEKEAEARKVALAAATSAPEVQREEQLPPKEQCRLCDDEIQPKKEEYFEYSCGTEIGKEVCHFYTHKRCLNNWYETHRGAGRKGEWKNTSCITGDCEETMLCVNIIRIDLEKTLHIKSNPVAPSSNTCKAEGKKQTNKKQHQREKAPSVVEAPRRPGQETVVQPPPAPIKHQTFDQTERDRHTSESKTIPAAPQTPSVSTFIHAESQSPVESVNPMRLPLQENVTRLVRKKDDMEEKYATKQARQVRQKDKKQQKKNIVTELQVKKQPTTDESSAEESGEYIEMDKQTDFPSQIEGRVTYPKPGTPAGKGYQEILLTALKPILIDLPSNCPKYQPGQARPVSDILEAILLVDQTVGPTGCGVLESPQIHYLKDLFQQGLPCQGTAHLKDFILSLGYFSVSWNNIINQWQYIVNEAGRRIQKRENNTQDARGTRDLRAEMKKAQVSELPSGNTSDADHYKASIEKMQAFDVTMPVPLNAKPQTKGNLFKKVQQLSPAPTSSSFDVEDASKQSRNLEDLKVACQRDFALVSSNLAHCDSILKSLADGDRFMDISSDMRSLKIEYETLEAQLIENIARLEDGDINIKPLGPIPELDGKAAALFKSLEDDAVRYYDKKIEPFWPIVYGRVQELALESNQPPPNRSHIKSELIRELQTQQTEAFDNEKAVENICFNLGIPYHRPSRHDDGTDDECLICLGKMHKSQKLSTLPCGVTFHYECLKPWLGQNRTCPHCRKLAILEEEYPRLGN